MRAVVVPEPGGPDALQVVERPDPEPGPTELLVRVGAAGVNRADLLQRQGHYPPPPGASDVPGLEAAGEVVAVGSQVEGWAVGDHACAVLTGGGYAELVTVPATVALPWPEGLDVLGAAAVPEVFATAYDNVCIRGGLAAGEILLVHGGSSGVGTAAIQLGKRCGCTVIVTAGSRDKLRACADLGASAGINYREEDFVACVAELTGDRGADVILDIIGGAYLDRNLRCLATEGRLVVIGLQGGVKAELNLGRLLATRGQILGSTLRARPVEDKAVLSARLRDEVWPGLADGSLRPVVHETFPLERVADAHRLMESSDHVGKIILTMR